MRFSRKWPPGKFKMDFAVARKRMVKEQLKGRGINDPRVLEAMSRIPRHEFVDEGMASQAYEDRPLSIGLKQTISQSYMVALMTESLGLQGHERVLEIGTGCGYQTAVLAELCRHVYSGERLSSLSNKARRTLYRLGYINFTLRIGDGTLGWPEESPFDAILVTAASPQVPPTYLKQLSPNNGHLVLPKGSELEQELIHVGLKQGQVVEKSLSACRFVKLYGQHGWANE